MAHSDKLIPKRLYEYNAGCYCGVYMPEHVMKKLAKLQCSYAHEVKKLLEENKSELYAADWTCVSSRDEDGTINKQTKIKYVTENDTDKINSRIRLFKPTEPEYCPEVYLVGDYLEANDICEDIHNEAV